MAEKKFSEKELLRAIQDKFKTLKAYAEHTDSSVQNVSDKIRRQSPKFLKELEEYGVIPSTEKGKINANSQSEVIPVRGIWLPVIKKVNGGDPVMIYREENREPDLIFVPEWEKEERCYGLRVVGDSMASGNGKSIHEGDIVICDMDAIILPGDIVAISLRNGREMIKQYSLGDSQVILRSFNTNNPDIIVKEQDILTMHRVMCVIPPIKRF